MAESDFILNDDLLEVVFRYLSAKQLIGCQRVSKQFKRCSENVIHNTTGLRVGSVDKEMVCKDRHHWTFDISDQIATTSPGDGCSDTCTDGFGWPTTRTDSGPSYNLFHSYRKFGIILKRFPNLKALYISRSFIPLSITDLIVKSCPKLECLVLDQILYHVIGIGLDAVNFTELSKCKLVHLAINRPTRSKFEQYPTFLLDINSLDRLTLNEFGLRPSLPELDHSFISRLPLSLRSLHLIRCQLLDSRTIDAIIRLTDSRLEEVVITTVSPGSQKSQLLLEMVHNLKPFVKVLRFDGLDVVEDGH